MSSWTAISKSEHANINWRARKNYSIAANQPVVEVLIAELSQLLPHYVLGFVLKEDQFHLVALLGFGESNYYVTADYKWMCEVLPAAIRSFPFVLSDNEDDEKVFCIDQDHLTDASEATPLFDESGELSKSTEEVFEFLKSCESSRRLTLAACDALAEAALIEPWPLNIVSGDSEEAVPIEGLYRISEAKLRSVSRTSLSKLRDSSALAIAYAQLFSTNQLKQLSMRSEILHQQEVHMDSQNELGSIFEDEDSLNFDAI